MKDKDKNKELADSADEVIASACQEPAEEQISEYKKTILGMGNDLDYARAVIKQLKAKLKNKE